MSTQQIKTQLAALVGLLLLAQPLSAQTMYRLSGRITDAATGAGIPFAGVGIKGTSKGGVSDAEGRYRFAFSGQGDSLTASSIGYQTRSLRLRPDSSQTLDLALTATATGLREVKVYAKGGDPAYRILREVIRRRDEFDPDRVKAYQFESYSKVEAYLNNFAEPRRKGRRPGPLGRALSKLPAITDENGKPAVPVYVSETASEFYYRSDPKKVKERILKSRASGVGISDGGIAAQLTGASFQQYNFYGNYVSLFRKDLPSPLGQFWKTLYTFHLLDTVSMRGTVCFEIDFEPQRASDLALNGTVWIDTTRYGLMGIDTRIDRRANINFVDEIRLSQEWEDVSDSTQARPVRLPVLTQLLIDTDQPTPRAPGLLLRFYVAVKNVQVDRPLEAAFYEPPLELADDYRELTPAYWQQARPESLSSQELRAFEVIDSVRNTPVMKAIGEVVKLTTLGYYPLKAPLNVELGPLLNSYAYNNVEGHRFRLGLRTDARFSRRWTLGGYAAYGTRDTRLKYAASVEYIVQKKPWTVLGLQHRYDLEQVGLSAENLGTNALFTALLRFGTLQRPYVQQSNYAYLRRELGREFTQTIGLSNRSFEPLFGFAYRTGSESDQELASTFQTTELRLETRFAPGELPIQNNNERVSLGASNRPVVLFRYQLGMNALGGDFTYHRFSLDLRHSFRLGVLGRTTYQANVGYIPSTIPYPLLHIPLGNQSIFQVSTAYNLMNYSEFVLDRYAGLLVEHNFEGLFFNRIPAIRRLKWRFLATGKVLVGDVSEANQALIPKTDALGRPVLGFQSLSRTPYLELGYGIDNIFKVFRVDAIHRLTYRSNPEASSFGIRVSAWLNL